MPRSLRQEIRQKKPFRSLEQEAHLSIVRTAAFLGDEFEQMLRPVGITAPQYNVLRILRGAPEGGMCRNDVRDRMLTRMPDMTRLLDRMEEAGLVTRERDAGDRRMVKTRITQRGRSVVDSLDAPVAELHERLLGHLSDVQLRQLIRLLAEARTAR